MNSEWPGIAEAIGVEEEKMPIYEYKCRRCHHRFEQIILSKHEKARCPKCESRAVEKQLSVFSAPAAHAEESASPGGCASCTGQGCGCH